MDHTILPLGEILNMKYWTLNKKVEFDHIPDRTYISKEGLRKNIKEGLNLIGSCRYIIIKIHEGKFKGRYTAIFFNVSEGSDYQAIARYGFTVVN